MQVGKREPTWAPATESRGGVMRIRRAIIPAILALGVAGSLVAGSAISAADGHAPRAQVVAASTTATHFHN